MDQRELKQVLDALARQRRYIISVDELHDVFGESRAQLRVGLHRQTMAGAITRLFPGIYANPQAVVKRLISRGDVVPYLRQAAELYVSLESALHVHRPASAAKPRALTVMTTGRSLLCDLEGLGAVEFVHTKRIPDRWADQLAESRYEGLALASYQLAIDDMLRTGRPLETCDYRRRRHIGVPVGRAPAPWAGRKEA
ncbi:hypothetical protein CSC66_09415 [Pseudoxanthomonas kaohsiungensis]|nr:hypothetical protein CSC66_09415 [Pseudoxanthomonas kaohsiungensis]